MKSICFLSCILATSISLAATPAPVDLVPLVKAAKPGATISLPLGAYKLSGQCVVTSAQKGITIVTPRASTLDTTASGAGWIVQGSNFSLNGFTVPKCPGCYFQPQAANILLTNSNIGWNEPPGSVDQAWKSGANCSNFSVTNCNVGITNTVSGYIDRGPFYIFDTTMLGAVGEYALRGETPDGVTIPAGFTVDSCNISNAGNAFGKDTIGFRMFHKCVVSNSIIAGDIRSGQSGQPTTTKPGQFNDTTITMTTFTAQKTGQFGFVVYQGVIASISHCTFVGPTQACIACSAQSTITEGYNAEHITAGERAYPLFSGAGTRTIIGADATDVVANSPTK